MGWGSRLALGQAASRLARPCNMGWFVRHERYGAGYDRAPQAARDRRGQPQWRVDRHPEHQAAGIWAIRGSILPNRLAASANMWAPEDIRRPRAGGRWRSRRGATALVNVRTDADARARQCGSRVHDVHTCFSLSDPTVAGPAMTASMDFLKPRSVAVIGASRDPAKRGNRASDPMTAATAARSCRSIRRRRDLGLACYADLAEARAISTSPSSVRRRARSRRCSNYAAPGACGARWCWRAASAKRGRKALLWRRAASRRRAKAACV